MKGTGKESVPTEVGSRVRTITRKPVPPLITGREPQSTRSRRSGLGRTPAAFLHSLSQPLLDELDSQIGGGAKGSGGRGAQIRRLAEHLESNRDATLILRGDSRPRPIELRAERTYLIGHGRHAPWELVSEAKTDPDAIEPRLAKSRRPWSFQLYYQIAWPELVAMYIHPCAWPFVTYGAEIDQDMEIPDNTIVVTDLLAIKFSKKLTMGKNSRLVGLHPCGLKVYVENLIGASGSMDEWPMISTSARSIEEQTLQLTEVDGYEGLALVSQAALDTRGSRGAGGEDGDSAVGASGDDGYCGLSFKQAEDGGDVDSDDVGSGGSGSTGGDGVSARNMRVHIANLSGRVRFEATGGDGGTGGQGGLGGTAIGGTGGNMGWLCGIVGGQPGIGGSAGSGGPGGDGGGGGDGGDGGRIDLQIDNQPSGGPWRACVRGGRPGSGGAGGKGGDAIGGANGYWLAAPFQQVFSRQPGGPRGDDGSQGPAGTKGWNGSIRFNGELVFEENNSENVASYRYPPGTATLGAEEGCWTD